MATGRLRSVRVWLVMNSLAPQSDPLALPLRRKKILGPQQLQPITTGLRWLQGAAESHVAIPIQVSQALRTGDL